VPGRGRRADPRRPARRARHRAARYADLGPDWHQSRIDKNRKAHSRIRHLEALGYTVTMTQAA